MIGMTRRHTGWETSILVEQVTDPYWVEVCETTVEIEPSLVKGRLVIVMWEDAFESAERRAYEELVSSCWRLEVGKKRAMKHG